MRASLKRMMMGVVVRQKTDKTAVVSVSRRTKDKIFNKYLKKTKIYAVHDEKNEAKIGDSVEIVETRPISKTKRWKIQKVLSSSQAV